MKSLLLLRCCGWCYCFCGCCRCYYYFGTLDSIACLCFFCFADLWAHKNRLNDDPIWCVCLRTYFICFLLSSSFSLTSSSSFLRLSFVPILPVSACFILICVLRVRVSNMLNAQVFFVAMHSPYAHSLITHEMVCVCEFFLWHFTCNCIHFTSRACKSLHFLVKWQLARKTHGIRTCIWFVMCYVFAHVIWNGKWWM